MTRLIHPLRTAVLRVSLPFLLAVSGCGGGDPTFPSTAGSGADSDMKTIAAVGATASSEVGQASPTANAIPVTGIHSGSGWVSPALRELVKPLAAEPASFSGRGWYIDQASGNDANPGTMAAPWRSFAPVASIRMAAGDALLLKCGDVYRDSLEIESSQAPAGNILIGAWGDCSGDRRPVIRASDWLSPVGWTRLDSSGSPVYTKTYAKPVKRVFFNGLPLIKARYPNFGGVGSEFALTTGGVGLSWNKFSVRPADLAVLASRDIVGATVHLKVTQWGTTPSVVQAFDPVTGVITLDKSMPFVIQPGSGYILEGKSWMLDSPGEWWADDQAKRLHLWTPSGVSPGTLAGLEVSWRAYGLVARWIENLRVQRLAVEQQDVDGFELLETPGAMVSDVRARQVQELGISLLDAPHAVVVDSQVDGSGRSGIVAREAPQAQILRNRVSDNGGGNRAAASEAAIAIFGEGSLVQDNVVERAAFLGIRFANRPGTVVRGNAVYDFCIRFTDCAGIYSYTGGSVASMPADFTLATTVEHNTIAGAKSNPEGCGYSCSNLANGVYLDELTSGVVVRNNSITETEIGIGLLNSSHNHIIGNQIFGIEYAALRGTKTRSDAAVFRGNLFTENRVYMHRKMSLATGGLPVAGASPVTFYLFSYADPAALFSGAKPNVITGNRTHFLVEDSDTTWTFANWNGSRLLSQADWRSFAPTDAAPTMVGYKPFIVETEASLIQNGGFQAGAFGWRVYSNPAGAGGTLRIASSLGGNQGVFIPGSSSDYLESNAFSLNGTPGSNLHLLRYTATGSIGGGLRKAIVRRAVAPWDTFGLNLPAMPLAFGETKTTEAFFLASAAQGNAVLDLRGALGGRTVFRDVSLSRVRSIEFADAKKLVSFAVNPTAEAISFPCSALGLSSCDLVDQSGQTVTFPITVAARGSRTLYARDPRWMK